MKKQTINLQKCTVLSVRIDRFLRFEELGKMMHLLYSSSTYYFLLLAREESKKLIFSAKQLGKLKSHSVIYTIPVVTTVN